MEMERDEMERGVVFIQHVYKHCTLDNNPPPHTHMHARTRKQHSTHTHTHTTHHYMPHLESHLFKI